MQRYNWLSSEHYRKAAGKGPLVLGVTTNSHRCLVSEQKKKKKKKKLNATLPFTTVHQVLDISVWLLFFRHIVLNFFDQREPREQNFISVVHPIVSCL